MLPPVSGINSQLLFVNLIPISNIPIHLDNNSVGVFTVHELN